MLDLTHVYGFRFTPVSKALQLQHVTDNDPAAPRLGRGGFGDSFVGSWCLIAPPAAPSTDAAGNVTGACEAAGIEFGDQIIAMGQRDVRWTKFAQDAKAGEVVLFNVFGSRLLLAQNVTALTGAGGAYLNFDATSQTVSLVGIPAKQGGNAPYLSMTTTGIGLTSSTGKASLNVDGSQVTISGATASVDAGSITLGKNAEDFVALASLVMQALAQVLQWLNTHTHTSAASGSPTSPPIVPLLSVPAVASKRVRCA